MVIFVCGQCGMHFQVVEEYLLKRQAQKCPNCNADFPNDCVSSAIELIQSNNKHNPFKTFVVENKEIKGVINGTVSL